MTDNSNSNNLTRARGMTLIELMVSVAIISVMVMAFGQILSNARKLVSAGQATMRGNTAAAAMAGAFRQDISRVTPNGFLCINTFDIDPSDALNLPALQRYQPQLFMTIAGPVESINTNGQAANAGVVGFGVCNNDADASMLIWRAAWLLNRQSGTPPVGSDTFGGNYDMADIQIYTRSTINNMIQPGGWLNDGAGNVVPKTMTVPPTDLDGLKNLWKCLAVYCTNVTIAWTDGNMDIYDGKTLAWYSKDCPKDTNWRNRSAATATAAQPEYNANFGNSPALYRAMWTHENQTNWPTQVKIRFTLKDPLMPEDIRGMDYEVICPIGR